MENIRTKVRNFLKDYGMSYETIDMSKCCQAFIDEMGRGLTGEKSSLAMLPTYLEATFNVPRNEKVIVLDAGGTNFRVATVFFDDFGKIVIEKFRKYPMPGIHKELGKNSFFQSMSDYLKEVLGESRKIGFCFSYPIDIQPNKDGRVLRFSKEIKAPEVEGELVGENLKGALRAMGVADDYQIVLLNDTVATLLAGQAIDGESVFSSYIGFILGTGTNLCYIEQNFQIKKIKGLDPAKSQLINMESGGSNVISQGQIDMAYDKTTNNPGMFTFEKMISGRYLGGLSKFLFQAAAADGMFSAETGHKLTQIDKLTTIDINEFFYHPFNTSHLVGSVFKTCPVSDRTVAYYLLNSLVERAAKLAAVSISAAVIQSGKGMTPDSPVCVMAEGTTFYHVKSLKFKIEYYLHQFLTETKGRYWEFASIDNATLIGAAVAGLTNSE